jgi:hypothetical protein
MFSEKVDLNYDGGARLYKSYVGTVFSISLFLMIFAYGLKRFMVMLSLK